MTATDDPRTGAEGVPDDTMTLTEHLAELRVRIIRAGLAVAIGMVLIIAFYEQVLEFLVQPYVDLCTSKPEDFCPPDNELLNAISATAHLLMATGSWPAVRGATGRRLALAGPIRPASSRRSCVSINSCLSGIWGRSISSRPPSGYG